MACPTIVIDVVVVVNHILGVVVLDEAGGRADGAQDSRRGRGRAPPLLLLGRRGAGPGRCAAGRRRGGRRRRVDVVVGIVVVVFVVVVVVVGVVIAGVEKIAVGGGGRDGPPVATLEAGLPVPPVGHVRVLVVGPVDPEPPHLGDDLLEIIHDERGSEPGLECEGPTRRAATSAAVLWDVPLDCTEGLG